MEGIQAMRNTWDNLNIAVNASLQLMNDRQQGAATASWIIRNTRLPVADHQIPSFVLSSLTTFDQTSHNHTHTADPDLSDWTSAAGSLYKATADFFDQVTVSNTPRDTSEEPESLQTLRG